MDNTTIAKELLQSMKQANKRLFIIVIVLIIALVSTNAYWIWDSSQWEYELTDEYTVDTQNNGGNAIINTGNGEVKYNGESDLQKDQEEKTKVQEEVIDTSNE